MVKKWFRIKIKSPGGRYGQLPSESILLGLDNKPWRFRSHRDAQARIAYMMASNSYRIIPDPYKPTYEVV